MTLPLGVQKRRPDRRLSPGVVFAICILAIALGAAIASWMKIQKTAREISAVELQTSLFDAHMARALSCLDLAGTEIHNAEEQRISDMQLRISNGIMLCIVKNRQDAKMSVDGLSRCIEGVEAENLVTLVGQGDTPVSKPAC